MEDKIKIFVSYSHEDEQYITDFEKYFQPVEKKYDLNLYRDKLNKAGDQFKEKIDDNLNQADIVLLFVSKHFLCSDSCKKELEESLKLKEERNINIVPIILSTCEWKETNLKDLLCVPKDGKPVSDFEYEDKAWQDVSGHIKVHVEKLNQINQIQITEDFKKFLQDTEILTKAHHNKENILLNDIFIPPQLECYDENRELQQKDIDYKELEKDILIHKNVVIVGEDQSGKTTLCKKLFLALKKRSYLPVYVFDKDKILRGNIENRIEKKFNEQYRFSIEYSEIKDRVIPIIDNFHLAKNQQKRINNLSSYKLSILVIDDIYGLNTRNKEIIKNFKHFKIKEFLPSLRNELIRKWNQLTDDNQENENYQRIDERTELVNTTLGKIIGNGIIPSYPFFILTILSTYETANPLDENITSQGHCYQALIYIALRREIENKDIDIYLNFLNVISFEFFKTKKKEFGKDDLDGFISKYKEKYNLPIKQETLLSKLNKAKILVENSLGNLSFQYDYLYFYFVAKYLAEHIKENKKIIDNIIGQLHKNENAYIAIFISHHSKDEGILDEVVLNSMLLFDGNEPISLRKEEVSFMDEEIDHIIEASLPNTDQTPESNRQERLEAQDNIEGSKNKETLDKEEEEDPLDLEIRRSIKTVEVMGRIIKNRSGSLEKDKLKEIFENGMNVHLRFLSFFLELIKNNEFRESIIDFIKNRLEKIIEESKQEKSREKLKEIARIIFWNLNFELLLGVVYKTVHSLGSDNLINITNEVCDKINTPASFLVKHGILMWYSKNLQIDNISKKIIEKEFSGTAKKIIKYMIASHCSMHQINYKDKQKLEQKLDLSAKKLLINSPKKT